MPTRDDAAPRVEWLNLDDAAACLGCSTRTVRRYIADGHLPAYRIRGGRGIRIKRTDVNAMLVPVPTVAAR